MRQKKPQIRPKSPIGLVFSELFCIFGGCYYKNGRVLFNMLKITDKASTELQKVLDSDAQKNKNLILYFMGAG